jgi:DNA-directed RNA polymerase subunit RPC12/RpoP
VTDQKSGASHDSLAGSSGATVREHRQRPDTITCPWCGTTIPVKARGRTPKWCSDTCRHRAWEQQRAADSGRSAVQIVERPVVVQRTTRIPAPNPPAVPSGPRRSRSSLDWWTRAVSTTGICAPSPRRLSS